MQLLKQKRKLILFDVKRNTKFCDLLFVRLIPNAALRFFFLLQPVLAGL